MQRAWLAELVERSGFKPILPYTPRSLADLALYNAHYTDVARHPAWRDFMSRIQRLHAGSRATLEQGVLDKYGKNHDDELRAVMHVLSGLLNHVATLQVSYESAEKALRKLHNIPSQPEVDGFVQ